MNTYLDVYMFFLALVFLFLMIIAVIPGKKIKYAAKNYNPKVLVIMPCKGTDIKLGDNLKSAQDQTYKSYKFITVVASKSDEALKAIHATKTDYILANKKYSKGSGKVTNLASAMAKYTNYDIYVILDSDVLVSRNWLELLIRPFSDKSIGLSTAFPIFEPIGGIWSKVKHSWGYVGFGLMENERTRFGWGGSLAFRKELLKGNAFNYFAESISDDIALTKIAKRLKFKIAYVPEANPIVYTNDNFQQFVEWSTRQTAFSIAGSNKILYYGIAFYSANVLLLVSGIVLGIAVNPILFALLLPFVLNAAKAYKRSKSLHVLAIYPFINFVYLFNLLKASTMRSVKWRGRTYDISKIPKTEIKI